ncbi:hypothetical protein MA16_Dca010327 [Dendrobium catenatum]|uniref:Uncharacterized protein n=1 Tax=Dendrobium catenatum TaxID=906689 RepID=A0A2I0X7Z7_9ASPA|nr:hypothetical protein MA16_Dca010327 [Dendrobium catenatum]
MECNGNLSESADIANIKKIIAAICVINEYYETYICKTTCMTSSSRGDKWIGELLQGHPTRFHNMFRMSQTIFLDLLFELECVHHLHGSSRTTNREVLAMTLYILSHNESIKSTCERFQHSTETISRYFSIGLEALVKFSCSVIKPVDPQFGDIPRNILYDNRYMSYFKDCIGAIDGTHVGARVLNAEKAAYIGRCGSTTQNVMAVCDFNMCFTFIMARWEGSAHDSRIFKFATRNRRNNFPMPPAGKYYVVDAGYPMQRGFFKPFPDTKYHIPDFERGSQLVRGRKETFNKRHSSLRGVIERSFGVWKKKWVILRDMPTYSFKKQIKIVIATMTLHNYIRRHPSREDPDFNICDANGTYIPEEAYEYRIGQSVVETEGNDFNRVVRDGEGAEEMVQLRDKITDALMDEMN